jgi:S-DNA-T family DNA segregation ATPase FtsK/SpoIIIE
MRYRKFSQTDIRNIKEANKMPSIIIIVDEFTDLLRNKAESFIFALARKGRASGIHLILSTQHPCRDIVKSPLQANIPARISFRTARDIDSRVILGVKGAESLLGKGDMLFMGIDSPVPRRIHAPLVTANEIKNIVSWFR